MSNIQTIADQIGDLRAQLKVLKDQESKLVELLKAEHVELAEGNNYRVAITYGAERKVIGWKNIAEQCKPSYQLVAAHTTVSVYDSVRVSAHSK